MRYKVNKTTAKDLLKPLENLTDVLQTVHRFIDAKLADYVFFPLSQLFGESKKLPPRVLERSLICLRFLILHGWRDSISSEVGKQLLILLAFLAGGSPTDPKPEQVDEDVALNAFDCTTALFKSSVASSLGSHGTVNPESIPLLGHAVTVILEGIANASPTRVRLAASRTLNALVDNLDDEDALENFFPGIVSTLTKVLSAGMRTKTPYRLLEACIRLLDQVFRRILTDDRCLHPVVASDISKRVKTEKGRSWVEATSGQVKQALSSIVPLRYHDRLEVQDSLFSFCTSVLTNCRRTLENCTTLMLETLVILSANSTTTTSIRRLHQLQQLLASDAGLLDVLKESTYDWAQSLPRIITSNDETKRTKILHQLSSAFRLLFAQDVDLKSLNDLTANNLQSSVCLAIEASTGRTISAVANGSADVGQMLQSAAPSKDLQTFAPVIFDFTSQGSIVEGLQSLISQFHNSAMSTALERTLTESLKLSTGNEQIASFWLVLQLLGNSSRQALGTEEWLNLPGSSLDPLAEDAYAFSLEVLEKSTYDDTVDWRLQALSLEVLTLQARSQGAEFRPELVDALYPVLERMGSSNALLQQHAVTCLSIVSHACGYSSASELVVDNADYLVNAVAVKLNTFDISPQASQVMLMMVRLCGSVLIPYLDDLIESIFAILACYHGYPRLVESLFEVLQAVVEEESKSSTKAIDASVANLRKPYNPTSVTDIMARLDNLKNKPSSDSPPSSPEPPSEPEPPAPPSTNQPSPTSKPHVLIHTITLQTTHHLSTPSLPLRRLLLSLIASSLPTLLAQDDPPTSSSSPETTNNDHQFLPLLATLWPHITRQIFPPSSSPSPNTSSFHNSKPASTAPSTSTIQDLPTLLLALATLTATLQTGGSFLLSRCETLLPPLAHLAHNLHHLFSQESRTLGPARAQRGLKYKCWDALVGAVVAMVMYVGITREMEEGVFEVLGEALVLERGVGGGGGGGGKRKEEVRGVLEGVNPGGLWLLVEGRRGRERDGGMEDQGGWEKPVVEGWEFEDVEFY